MHGWAGDATHGSFHIASPIDHATLLVIASNSEEWQPIAGWSDLYEVSNAGRIRAFAKSVTIANGAVRRHEQIELAQEVMGKGYCRVTLCRGGERHKVLVHVLVAQAFIENPHSFPFVNHRNGDKANNGAANLEWCSEAYNQHHAIESGLRSGLTAEIIGQIRDMIAAGFSNVEITEKFAIKAGAASTIRNGNIRDLNPEEPSRYTGMAAWDHVSVSRKNRVPNWAEMSHVHRLFFRDDEVAMQLHVPISQHINCHPFVLHLWRPHEGAIPLPPAFMV